MERYDIELCYWIAHQQCYDKCMYIIKQANCMYIFAAVTFLFLLLCNGSHNSNCDENSGNRVSIPILRVTTASSISNHVTAAGV